MERYERYKDSGIDWIGEIPARWDVTTLGRVVIRTHNGLTRRGAYDAEGCWVLRLRNICDGVIDSSYVSRMSLSDQELASFALEEGDFLFARVNGSRELVGKAALVEGANEAVAYNDHIIRVTFDMARCSTRYLLFYTQSDEGRREIDRQVKTSAGQYTISADGISACRIALPPLEEQRAIADYLDTKTAEIDALITDCEREVELLQEYRKSVISEAVTKGLDPDAPMKDSGIDWIGEISTGWTVTRFKYVGRVAANLQHPSDYQDKMHVAPENIEKDTGRLLSCSTVCIDGVESDNHLFKAGVVLYSKVRPALNKVTVAPFSGLCSADMYPIDTQNDSKWLMYYMLSSAFSRQVIVSTDRVKMPKINKEELGAFWVLLPPLEEQRAIADYLDEKTSQIDGLIDAKRQMAEKLREYRKSLISEAVTGKFKVPGI